jgi:hypothetical protein
MPQWLEVDTAVVIGVSGAIKVDVLRASALTVPCLFKDRRLRLCFYFKLSIILLCERAAELEITESPLAAGNTVTILVGRTIDAGKTATDWN